MTLQRPKTRLRSAAMTEGRNIFCYKAESPCAIASRPTRMNDGKRSRPGKAASSTLRIAEQAIVRDDHLSVAMMQVVTEMRSGHEEIIVAQPRGGIRRRPR
jgi:hypothetical protein